MLIRQAKQNPLDEYVKSIKEAITGKNAAQDIQTAVTLLLHSYGINTPKRK